MDDHVVAELARYDQDLAAYTEWFRGLSPEEILRLDAAARALGASRGNIAAVLGCLVGFPDNTAPVLGRLATMMLSVLTVRCAGRDGGE
jgi:hypothetical protein